jgi:phytanoyl-CoA hydroxylase
VTDAPAALADAVAHYRAHGYLVRRGVVDAAACARALAAYRAEVKPARELLGARPGTAPPIYTPGGFVREPLANFHAEPPGQFPTFHHEALAVLTDATLHGVVRALLGEEGIVVETLVYEGNPRTWAHQDGVYFDSSPPGHMVGVWVALETIHDGAGRFFVHPDSHAIDVHAYDPAVDVKTDGRAYERLLLEILERERLPARAPALDAGDVVFWDARTVHGTFETTEPARSRASLNLHVVAASGGFQRFGETPVELEVRHVGGVLVHTPMMLGAAARAVTKKLLGKPES